MTTKFVVVRDMSAGNAETGDAWQETRIYEEGATLADVMAWADAPYGPKDGCSRKRITITRPYSEESFEL